MSHVTPEARVRMRMIRIANFVKDQNSKVAPTEILDFHGTGNKSTVISTATILMFILCSFLVWFIANICQMRSLRSL